MLKFLKKILVVSVIILMPAVAHAVCAINEIDVLGDGTQCELAKFTVTTTSLAAGTTFSFNMSAKGTFYVDWGDGNVQTISRANTMDATYSHSYANVGVYNIRFGGVSATGAPGYGCAWKFFP